MTIGEKIQFYRKREGMSQEELGSRLHLSRQTVSLWENGQTLPTIDNLIRLREIFNVSLDEMLGEEKGKLFERGVRLEEKTLSSALKKRLARLFLSLFPSLLCWGISIFLFFLFDVSPLFIGFLAGALFVDIAFSLKEAFSKLLKEKRILKGLKDKSAKLEVFEGYLSISLYSEEELLWKIRLDALEKPIEKASDEIEFTRECVSFLMKDENFLQECGRDIR